jgi:cytosine/adenosine deaminase-related metal-dependent hydrolase
VSSAASAGSGATALRAAGAGVVDIPSPIAEANASADRRVLLKDGCVLSMDPAVGNFERADVLVEGDTIAAIGPDLDTPGGDGTVVVDASGTIVIPGLVDTHRHMWQGPLRRMVPNVDIPVYLGLRNAFAVKYRPEDTYAGTLVTAMGALYAGITSILDLDHNARSARHADAAVDALTDAGIRAVYAYAAPEAGEWDRQWPDDLARIKEERFDDPDGMLRLRMSQRFASDVENLTPERIAMARSLGIGMVADPVAWDEGSAHILALATDGLLGPDMVFVHCSDLSEDAWAALGDANVKVALSPFVDEIMAFDRLGVLPTVQKALDVGIRPGLSVDIETTVPIDLFTQMRAVLTVQRMRGSLGNPDVDRSQLTVREVLAMATVHGAETIGLEDVCGSLTPGKKADVTILDQTSPMAVPFNNAYGSVVMGSDVASVTCVMVSGVVKKWGSSLVGLDTAHTRALIEDSRDYLAGRVGYEIDLFTDYPSIDLGPPQYRP